MVSRKLIVAEHQKKPVSFMYYIVYFIVTTCLAFLPYSNILHIP
jgi:hypothetical protein